jgi:hypothetical protein
MIFLIGLIPENGIKHTKYDLWLAKKAVTNLKLNASSTTPLKA